MMFHSTFCRTIVCLWISSIHNVIPLAGYEIQMQIFLELKKVKKIVLWHYDIDNGASYTYAVSSLPRLHQLHSVCPAPKAIMAW